MLGTQTILLSPTVTFTRILVNWSWLATGKATIARARASTSTIKITTMAESFHSNLMRWLISIRLWIIIISNRWTNPTCTRRGVPISLRGTPSAAPSTRDRPSSTALPKSTASTGSSRPRSRALASPTKSASPTRSVKTSSTTSRESHNRPPLPDAWTKG